MARHWRDRVLDSDMFDRLVKRPNICTLDEFDEGHSALMYCPNTKYNHKHRHRKL